MDGHFLHALERWQWILLYSNPLLSLSRWKRYPCVNFFQATVNVSLALLNSNPSEIWESSSLKGSRREEQWSLLQQGGHKPWQPRNSPDTARLPALVNTALRKTCVEDTVTEVGWRWRWGKLCKQSKSLQAKHNYGIVLENDLPPPHTCIRWTASHLISLNPITFK